MSKRTLFILVAAILLIVAPAIAIGGGHGANPAKCTGGENTECAGHAECSGQAECSGHADCAGAHGSSYGHGMSLMNPGSGHAAMFGNMKFTDEQQAKVDQIHADNKMGFAGDHGRALSMHEDMAKLIHSADYDEVAVQQMAEDMAAMQVEMIVANAGMMNQMYQLLTPEQLEQIEGHHGQYGKKGHHKASADKAECSQGQGGHHKN
jgi:Spy/CpxP family protein refolding chaperone